MQNEGNQNNTSLESNESQESQSLETQNTTENVADEQNLSQEASTEAAKQAKKLKAIKLKIDGQEIEESLPFEIEDNPEVIQYLQKQLQLAKVAPKRMSEYAELQRDVNDFLKLLQKDPIAALSDPSIGLDIKQFAQKVIEQEIENAKKSPEQLEKERLQNELKAIKEEREREKEESRRKDMERLQQQEFERYDMLLDKALEKSDLPKSPYVVKKMADYMLIGINEGIDVTPEDVLPLVREEILDDVKQMFGAMPEEVIERVIGKDTLNKIRKKNLAKARQNGAPVPVKSAVKDTAPHKTEPVEVQKKKSYRDFFGT